MRRRMKLTRSFAAILVSSGLAFAAIAAEKEKSEPAAGSRPEQGRGQTSIHWMRINGIITHGTAAYVERGIRKAEAAGASAVVIELDTPGGVVDSTR